MTKMRPRRRTNWQNEHCNRNALRVFILCTGEREEREREGKEVEGKKTLPALGLNTSPLKNLYLLPFPPILHPSPAHLPRHNKEPLNVAVVGGWRRGGGSAHSQQRSGCVGLHALACSHRRQQCGGVHAVRVRVALQVSRFLGVRSSRDFGPLPSLWLQLDWVICFSFSRSLSLFAHGYPTLSSPTSASSVLHSRLVAGVDRQRHMPTRVYASARSAEQAEEAPAANPYVSFCGFFVDGGAFLFVPWCFTPA